MSWLAKMGRVFQLSESQKNTILEIQEGITGGSWFLHGLSALFKGVVWLRNWAYDCHLLRSKRVNIPVISIGNIVAGGAGKTPVARFLASSLGYDYRLAILSRGYRSESERSNKKVTPQTCVAECGDEPFWLARQLPHVQVWVGKNRFRSAQKAEEAGADIILLDDGLQHRQLHRDLEIIVMGGNRPLGNGFFLPQGTLRDLPSRLKRADLIVVTDPEEGFEKSVRKYTQAPIVEVRVQPKISLEGKKVAAFCAIAQPERFIQTIRKAGGEVVASWYRLDHDRFEPEELEAYRIRSKADLLVCTEKDFVKLPSSLTIPVQVLTTELQVSNGFEAWQQLLDNIKAHHDRRIQRCTS